MKKEVYSWRLSSELKSDLERESRLRQTPVSVVLEEAVRTWLDRPPDSTDAMEQQKLHEAAALSVGIIAGKNRTRSVNVSKFVRERIRRRNVR